mmetsp:Transcript_59577/g.133936  ORF Transcript_59577/g.133936 Transcript_59577/m.133936 type:complete len:114 (+) Transcript_59577:1-342(+)
MGFLFYLDLELSLMKYAGRASNSAVFEHTLAFLLEGLVDLWDWLQTIGLSQPPEFWLFTRVQAVLSRARCIERPNPRTQDAMTALKHRVDGRQPSFEVLGTREFAPQGLIQMG